MELKQEIRDGFAQRLDTHALRLDRHRSNWEAGRSWGGTMDWAEKIDAALEAKDREIAELHKRLAEIENKLR